MDPNAKTKNCVFCGRSSREVKISGEHVIRKALMRLFPEATGHAFNRRETGTDPVLRTLYDVHLLDVKVNRVCKPCNEGWLDVEVDRKVESLLERLIVGAASSIDTIVLGAGDQFRLALWATKTAATRYLLDLPLPVDGDKLRYAWMFEQRSPPPNTRVWLVHREPDPNISGRHLYFRFAGGAGYIHEVCFNLKGIQVHVLDESAVGRMTLSEVSLHMQAWSAVQQIWPLSGHDIIWPPLHRVSAGLAEVISGCIGEALGFFVHESPAVIRDPRVTPNHLW